MKVYLCSRVAKEAHFANNLVANSLRGLGHEVFVPHMAPYNESGGAEDADIFRQDFKEMVSADVCVAVGRLGIDCAWEVGHFQGSGKPVYWVMSEMHEKESPMLHSVRRVESINELKEVLRNVA